MKSCSSKILTYRGKIILVDREDFTKLSKFKWCLTNGYPSRRQNISVNKSKIVYMHRIVMNTPEGMITDHINGDKLDNRKKNKGM